MTTFVQAVSRLLRHNSYLSNDDSDIVTFSDVQHKGTIQIAIIAIQNTLNEVATDRLIPSERVDGTITLLNGVRTYSLPTDFIRFADDPPFMLQLDENDLSENRILYEYSGGVNKLSQQIMDYREQLGTPFSWYYLDGLSEQVGFYQVPDSTVNNRKVRFSYEKEIMVNVEADVLPFSKQSMDYAFIHMAARRFQFIKANTQIDGLSGDTVYNSAKVSLTNLLRFKNPPKKYGYSYR